MNKNRLLKLADFLETVPRKSFDMGDFGRFGSAGENEPRKFSGKFDCGFAGCAIGWAAQGRLFPGLRYSNDGDTFTFQGDDADGFQIAERLFDIGAGGSMHLFSRAAYTAKNPRPQTVAKRIRKFVANNGAL
jgi:hypothetical protein